MDPLSFFAKWIIGPIISVIVTLLVSEPIKNWLAPFVSKFGVRKDDGINGRWQATFFYGPDKKEYREAIEVSTLLGVIVGRIFPHSENYDGLKTVEAQKPVRLRGTVKDNRYFTGVWFHPKRRSHYHGAFHLLIDTHNERMNGSWLGYSESKNVIESGEWRWSRLPTP